MRLSLLLLLSLTLFASASANNFEGYVYDDYGIPIEDATVYHLNSGTHEHTNAFGHFLLENVAIGDSIEVQALGFALSTQIVGDPSQALKLSLEPLFVELATVSITPDIEVAQEINRIDVATRPAVSSQELLRTVPGLFIGQHAGGGKAEQMFLRGFDVDHGTDIAISVDGLPVNMVSQAHGQGYSDLHFVIPETVEFVDYTLGPYDARVGNFATAASINLQTKRSLRQNLLQLEGGQFGLRRGVGMISLWDKDNSDAYVAVEGLLYDGPFDSPQDLSRYNAFAKTNFKLAEGSFLSVSGSYFTSTWTASGQIPERAVRSGLIDRFGAIDNTEGGKTGRTNISAKYSKVVGDDGVFKAQVFGSLYDFELFSNFTFFLEDPSNGDQIVQREDRKLAGSMVSFADHFDIGEQEMDYTAGVQSRHDFTNDSELSRTLNRTTLLERIQFGDISENTFSGFAKLASTFGKWRATIGARVDQTFYSYEDQLEGGLTTSDNSATINPKASVTYSPNNKLQVFAKAGSGYHANDTRLVIANDSRTFQPQAYGTDLGIVVKPTDRIVLRATAWNLRSEQEFVYVGDAGVVEPSGRSNRMGLDFGARATLVDNLYFGGDVTLVRARSIDEPDGADRIPLAPPLTVQTFLIYSPAKGFHANANLRILGDRAANEDNSIVARGYEVIDATVGYTWRNYTIDLIADNVLDVEWNETQFATESRLRNETAPIEEIHFTPGTPRAVRLKLGYRF